MRHAALLLWVAGCASASPDADTTDAVGANNALIGGQPATVERFPSTVYLKTGCTATKVGERFLLTAAHCVLSTSSNDPKWKAGDPLGVSRVPANGYRDLPVAAVHVHPDWLKGCAEAYCASSLVSTKLDAPDVAVIEFASDIGGGIPNAKIETTPLAPAADVIEIGFGCTEGVSKKDERTDKTLLFADAKLVDATHAVHDGSGLANVDLPNIGANYALTDGPGRSAKKSGLCPGDSGGPLYRETKGALVVVGVNSNYTFLPEDQDEVGLPVSNWHTRLDDGSKHHVATWLKSVGIALP